MEEHRLNAFRFFKGTKWVRKFTSCTSVVVVVMFHSRLEEMIRWEAMPGSLYHAIQNGMTMGIENQKC
jgi:cobalamin-dependent methionine synthase I